MQLTCMKNAALFAAGAVGVGFIGASPAALGQTFNTGVVTVQCDNYHAIFTGSLTTTHGLGGSSGIFPPAAPGVYNIATSDSFVYIAAWSDGHTNQGLLFDMTINGNRITPANPNVMVYATGHNFNTLVSPTTTTMDTQIALANIAGGAAGSTSVGWVLPAIGGVNDGNFPAPTFYAWPIQPGIGTDANWIWYDNGTFPGPTTWVPFHSGWDYNEFLIFRIPIAMCAPNPCPADFNHDGKVDAADLATLLANWGLCLP